MHTLYCVFVAGKQSPALCLFFTHSGINGETADDMINNAAPCATANGHHPSVSFKNVDVPAPFSSPFPFQCLIRVIHTTSSMSMATMMVQ
jgi:hypothetical protein